MYYKSKTVIFLITLGSIFSRTILVSAATFNSSVEVFFDLPDGTNDSGFSNPVRLISNVAFDNDSEKFCKIEEEGNADASCTSFLDVSNLTDQVSGGGTGKSYSFGANTAGFSDVDFGRAKSNYSQLGFKISLQNVTQNNIDLSNINFATTIGFEYDLEAEIENVPEDKKAVADISLVIVGFGLQDPISISEGVNGKLPPTQISNSGGQIITGILAPNQIAEWVVTINSNGEAITNTSIPESSYVFTLLSVSILCLLMKLKRI